MRIQNSFYKFLNLFGNAGAKLKSWFLGPKSLVRDLTKGRMEDLTLSIQAMNCLGTSNKVQSVFNQTVRHLQEKQLDTPEIMGKLFFVVTSSDHKAMGIERTLTGNSSSVPHANYKKEAVNQWLKSSIQEIHYANSQGDKALVQKSYAHLKEVLEELYHNDHDLFLKVYREPYFLDFLETSFLSRDFRGFIAQLADQPSTPREEQHPRPQALVSPKPASSARSSPKGSSDQIRKMYASKDYAAFRPSTQSNGQGLSNREKAILGEVDQHFYGQFKSGAQRAPGVIPDAGAYCNIPLVDRGNLLPDPPYVKNFDGRPLHANQVHLKEPNLDVIVAQAPQEASYFLSHLENQRVSTVVDLTSKTDDLSLHERYYFPEGTTPGETRSIIPHSESPPVQLTLLNETSSEGVIRQKYSIKVKDRPEHIFERVHYTKWADFEGADVSSLHQLVQSLSPQFDGEKKNLVHCRAGVGRSGTFVTAMALYRLRKRGVQLTDKLLADLIVQGREQRGGYFVQKNEQLKSLVQYLDFLNQQEPNSL